MKLNAICMVKNEVDVLLETLTNALDFCDTIYVFDNGSTDGTSEALDQFIIDNPKVVLAERSDEIFRNQLRNRVYNKFHQQYSKQDWWYILDADEMLSCNPKPILEKASLARYDSMRVWQAQFYFTDNDYKQYAQEDKSLPITLRRRWYRINWREPRFFKNDPKQNWPETISGRVPPFCQRFYPSSPICRHYAERTPEQIQARVNIRINNPYSFFHLKGDKYKSISGWLKKADDLFYYQNDNNFNFPLSDRIVYFAREAGYWINWRVKNMQKWRHVLKDKCFS